MGFSPSRTIVRILLLSMILAASRSKGEFAPATISVFITISISWWGGHYFKFLCIFILFWITCIDAIYGSRIDEKVGARVFLPARLKPHRLSARGHSSHYDDLPGQASVPCFFIVQWWFEISFISKELQWEGGPLSLVTSIPIMSLVASSEPRSRATLIYSRAAFPPPVTINTVWSLLISFIASA